MIFKRVGDTRPYPELRLTAQQWTAIAPVEVRIADLVTTRSQLDLAAVLDENSTFYGDLFAHVVSYDGELYLDNGLHRTLRAALQQRTTIHARVYTVASHHR